MNSQKSNSIEVGENAAFKLVEDPVSWLFPEVTTLLTLKYLPYHWNYWEKSSNEIKKLYNFYERWNAGESGTSLMWDKLPEAEYNVSSYADSFTRLDSERKMQNLYHLQWKWNKPTEEIVQSLKKQYAMIEKKHPECAALDKWNAFSSYFKFPESVQKVYLSLFANQQEGALHQRSISRLPYKAKNSMFIGADVLEKITCTDASRWLAQFDPLNQIFFVPPLPPLKRPETKTALPLTSSYCCRLLPSVLATPPIAFTLTESDRKAISDICKSEPISTSLLSLSNDLLALQKIYDRSHQHQSVPPSRQGTSKLNLCSQLQFAPLSETLIFPKNEVRSVVYPNFLWHDPVSENGSHGSRAINLSDTLRVIPDAKISSYTLELVKANAERIGFVLPDTLVASPQELVKGIIAAWATETTPIPAMILKVSDMLREKIAESLHIKPTENLLQALKDALSMEVVPSIRITFPEGVSYIQEAIDYLHYEDNHLMTDYEILQAFQYYTEHNLEAEKNALKLHNQVLFILQFGVIFTVSRRKSLVDALLWLIEIVTQENTARVNQLGSKQNDTEIQQTSLAVSEETTGGGEAPEEEEEGEEGEAPEEEEEEGEE